MFRYAMLLLIASTLLSGCMPPPRAPFTAFSQELRNANRLTDEELKNLQFYLAHDITLQRRRASGDRQVSGSHKLVIREGLEIDEVLIADGTPGVAVGVGDNWLAVSFEPGTSLLFGSMSTETYQGTYFLKGTNWSDREGGIVNYDGKAYRAVAGSQRAYLMNDQESVADIVRKRKVLPGIKLPGSTETPAGKH